MGEDEVGNDHQSEKRCSGRTIKTADGAEFIAD